MKYVGFYEMDQEDKYKVFELDDKLGEEYRRDLHAWQKKYGKFMGAYFLGMEPKGISLFEFDTQEQMINMERAYWPYKRWRFVPLIDVDKVKQSYNESWNQATVEDEEGKVREMMLRVTKAIHQKDLDAYVDGYTDDAIVIQPQSQIIRGKEQWRSSMAKALKVIESIKYDELIVRVDESRNHGYVIGDFMAVEDSSKGQSEFRERLHATVIKKDGEWKISAISFSR